jgi:uncharacterized coiled-coil protein SlyX
MRDDVMALDERLAKLKVTVAGAFSELGGRIGGLDGRMDRLEDRLDAMNAKLDAVSETLTDKMQLVLERLDAHAGEMRVTVKAIVEEHRADRRLMYSMLHDHGVRIRALEQATSPASAPPEAPAP